MRAFGAQSARRGPASVVPWLGLTILLLRLAAGREVVLAVAHPPDADLVQAIPAVPGFEKCQQWALQVRRHEPGQWDEAARTVATWPADDLQLLRGDLAAVASLLAWQSTPSDPEKFGTLLPSPTAPREGSYSRPMRGRRGASAFLRVVKLSDVPALLGLPADGFRREVERQIALPPAIRARVSDALGTKVPFDVFSAAVRALQAEVIPFMEQAAMLHADIAALAPPQATHAAANSGPDSQSIVMRVLDGQAAGLDAEPVHWEIARSALDAMRPDPSTSAAVRQFVQTWYRATAAHQLSRRAYGQAGSHLEHARAKLVDDAWIQLYSGVVQENQAAPTVQVALQSLGANGATRLDVAPIRESLEHAEGYFQRAIELAPTQTVALVHHARVIGLLGRHEAAVEELRRARPAVTDPVQAYYVDLFLGAEEHALGHRSAAREAFEAAMARGPQAQSPRLALSQLAWQNGDRANALAAFDALAKLPAPAPERVDPWWSYDVSTVFDHGALVAGLIAAARQARAR